MKTLRLVAVTVSLFAAGGCWQATAAPGKAPAKPSLMSPGLGKPAAAAKWTTVEREEAARFEQLSLAARLASVGRIQKNALAMVTAADLFARVPTKPAVDGSADDMPATAEARALLKEAIALAPDEPAVVEAARLVEEQLRVGERAPVRFRLPIWVRDVVKGKSVWTKGITMAGGRSAKVSITVDASEPVTMAVLDSGNRVIWRDDSVGANSYAYHMWVPARNERFTVWVGNYGSAAVKFSLTAY
ncbi:MAG TPA: hypothetical protein VGM37_15145 [Armatimonadota bacterium]|jgi:hypothetical protein